VYFFAICWDFHYESYVDSSFYSLGPNQILNSVEESLAGEFAGLMLTGRAQALNSIENRVYEIELENKHGEISSVVAKFYRPDRWSSLQILEEHEFLQELKLEEVPVVEALALQGSRVVNETAFAFGNTLARTDDGIYFALFRKIRARSFDELNLDQLKMFGRFLARLHVVGSRKKFRFRNSLSVVSYGWDSLKELGDRGFLDDNLGQRYEKLVLGLLEILDQLMQEESAIRLHGDCHLGNLLWLDDRPIFVDFDDSLMGPPVQDIWMVAHRRDDRNRKLSDTLIDAYEEMREFPSDTLRLIEALRCLRLIHYSAWIAKRWEDPSFPKMFPHFGGEKWWSEEIEALSQISEILQT